MQNINVTIKCQTWAVALAVSVFKSRIKNQSVKIEQQVRMPGQSQRTS